jgi:hypothetical protein
MQYLGAALTDSQSRDAFAKNAMPSRTVSGTTDTLVLADLGGVVDYTSASAVTVTVPTNASVAFPLWTPIALHQSGAGKVSVVGAGGVTINKVTNFNASATGQYGVLQLLKTGTDTWTLFGALEAA